MTHYCNILDNKLHMWVRSYVLQPLIYSWYHIHGSYEQCAPACPRMYALYVPFMGTPGTPWPPHAPWDSGPVCWGARLLAPLSFSLSALYQKINTYNSFLCWNVLAACNQITCGTYLMPALNGSNKNVLTLQCQGKPYNTTILLCRAT